MWSDRGPHRHGQERSGCLRGHAKVLETYNKLQIQAGTIDPKTVGWGVTSSEPIGGFHSTLTRRNTSTPMDR